MSLQSLLDAAPLTCFWKSEPAIHKAVAQIEQYWFNWTGLPPDKATESFRLRLQTKKWDADRKTACDANKEDEEVGGEEAAFKQARRKLFGCGNGDDALWVRGGGYTEVDDGVMVYLDGSATAADELVRLGYLTTRTRFILADERSDYFDKFLLNYITDQFDLAAVNDAELTKQIDASYKGNIFVRGVALESLGRIRLAAAAYKAELDKKSKDDGWKQLLVTAPQKGAADFNTSAAKWKAELGRSMEFEKKYFGPSRKALKGCWADLRKDFVAVAKTLKHGPSAKETEQSVNDPVASLLFSRLAACAVVDQDAAYANRLLSISRDLRPSRGPRVAAYYAALDAFAEIKEDRKKFPIEAENLKRYIKSPIHEAASKDIEVSKSKIDTMGWAGDAGQGVVKAVKKTDKGLQVTWATQKYKTMSQSCTETNRIVMFDHSGRPIYYRKCKDTGMITVDATPIPMTIPTEWTDGIKVGALVEFETARGNDVNRYGMPIAVFADKNKKKLVNWQGFGL